MALTKGFKPEYMIGCPVIPTETIAEGASQTFKKGEVLVVSGGYAVATAGCATDDTPTLGTIIGIAAEDAHNASAGAYNITYTPAYPHMVFSGQLMYSAGTALAVTDVFSRFGVDVTSNVWWLEGDETTDERVVVIALKDAIGTVDGRVFFTFLPEATAFMKAAAN